MDTLSLACRNLYVRYADDIVAGFEHRADAERFLQEWKDRLQKFGLELHPDKTRLIVGGGEKGYQFGGREGAMCGVTLWPPLGRRKGKKLTASSQAGLSSRLTSGVR
jgi:hypothetical protein